MRTVGNPRRQQQTPQRRVSNQTPTSQHPPGVIAVDGGGSEMLLAIEHKVPLFLVKMWRIVNDPNLSNVVGWDETGMSFHIHDPYAFCKFVLPQFFKHNNLNSLIRQLNMYGFRKITPLERTGLSRAESDREHVEFQHPSFVRDHPELLVQIRRKVTAGNPPPQQYGSGAQLTEPSDVKQSRALDLVLEEVRQLKEKQAAMDTRLAVTMQQNENLWREVAHLRQLHVKQQQVVNKLIQFLVRLVQPAAQHLLPSTGGRNLLAIGHGNEMDDVDVEGDETTPGPSDPKRPRLFDTVVVESALNALERQLDAGQKLINRPNSNSRMVIQDVTDHPELLNAANDLSSSQQKPVVDFSVDRGRWSVDESGRPQQQQQPSPASVMTQSPAAAAPTTTANTGRQNHDDWTVSIPFNQLNTTASDYHLIDSLGARASSTGADPSTGTCTLNRTDGTMSGGAPHTQPNGRPVLISGSSVDSADSREPWHSVSSRPPDRYRNELGDFLTGVDSSLDLFRGSLSDCDMDTDTLRDLFTMCERQDAVDKPSTSTSHGDPQPAAVNAAGRLPLQENDLVPPALLTPLAGDSAS